MYALDPIGCFETVVGSAFLHRNCYLRRRVELCALFDSAYLFFRPSERRQPLNLDSYTVAEFSWTPHRDPAAGRICGRKVAGRSVG